MAEIDVFGGERKDSLDAVNPGIYNWKTVREMTKESSSKIQDQQRQQQIQAQQQEQQRQLLQQQQQQKELEEKAANTVPKAPLRLNLANNENSANAEHVSD